jgi:hypothetical protein
MASWVGDVGFQGRVSGSKHEVNGFLKLATGNERVQVQKPCLARLSFFLGQIGGVAASLF